MDELKLIFASNLIKLRTEAGYTQAELGGLLNYSDKTVSKWERGEAIPDAFVLKQISALFQVSIDDILTSHDEWKRPNNDEEELRYSRNAIAAVTLAGILTAAVLIFVIFWIVGNVEWLIFALSVPVCLITMLVFNLIWWKNSRASLCLVEALVLSIIAIIYIILRQYNPWQLFLVAIPAALVVWISFRIKRVR